MRFSFFPHIFEHAALFFPQASRPLLAQGSLVRPRFSRHPFSPPFLSISRLVKVAARLTRLPFFTSQTEFFVRFFLFSPLSRSFGSRWVWREGSGKGAGAGSGAGAGRIGANVRFFPFSIRSCSPPSAHTQWSLCTSPRSLKDQRRSSRSNLRMAEAEERGKQRKRVGLALKGRKGLIKPSCEQFNRVLARPGPFLPFSTAAATRNSQFRPPPRPFLPFSPSGDTFSALF